MINYINNKVLINILDDLDESIRLRRTAEGITSNFIRFYNKNKGNKCIIIDYEEIDEDKLKIIHSSDIFNSIYINENKMTGGSGSDDSFVQSLIICTIFIIWLVYRCIADNLNENERRSRVNQYYQRRRRLAEERKKRGEY